MSHGRFDYFIRQTLGIRSGPGFSIALMHKKTKNIIDARLASSVWLESTCVLGVKTVVYRTKFEVPYGVLTTIVKVMSTDTRVHHVEILDEDSRERYSYVLCE